MTQSDTSAPKADALPGCATPRPAVPLGFEPVKGNPASAVRGNGRRNTARTGNESPGIVPNHGEIAQPPQARFGQKRLCEADGCVMYFLAGAGLIKIGISTGLTSRLRAIRNSSPVPLELLATLPSNNVHEGFTHDQFAHLRKHGEWFTDDGEIRAHIENLVRSGKAERPK